MEASQIYPLTASYHTAAVSCTSTYTSGLGQTGSDRRALAGRRGVRAHLAELTPELELLRVGEVVLDERYHISIRGHLWKNARKEGNTIVMRTHYCCQDGQWGVRDMSFAVFTQRLSFHVAGENEGLGGMGSWVSVVIS